MSPELMGDEPGVGTGDLADDLWALLADYRAVSVSATIHTTRGPVTVRVFPGEMGEIEHVATGNVTTFPRRRPSR